MIIFLYGPDDYRREEKRSSIQEEFLKKYSSLSLGRFDVSSEDGFKEFKNFVRNKSLFEAKKIVVLESALEIDAPNELIKLIASFLGDKNTTIILSEKGKPTKAFSSLLEKPALAQEFRHLEGKDWEQFISGIAKKNEVVLDDSARLFLARVYAGNSWGLATEVQKLSSLGKKTIAKADLEGTMLEAAPDFWSVMNGLKSHEIGRRLFVLEKLFAAHEPAAKIFNILSSVWKERAREFADYDLKIKSGKLDYEEVLVSAVLG